MKLEKIVVISILLSSLAAHAQVPGTSPPLQQIPNPPAAMKDGVVLSDKALVENAMQSLATQVELSKIANQNVSDEKVREYAGWILKDYEPAIAQLRQLAADARIDTPKALDADHSKIVASLREQPGPQSGARYIELIKTEHDNLLTLLDIAHGQSTVAPEFREFGDKLVPTLKQYQKRAQTLQKANIGQAASQ